MNLDYFNKFEIPLTIPDTEKVFINITQSILNSYINSVFTSVYYKYSGSARVYNYQYNEQEYHHLLQRINELKPVILTIPGGDIGIIEKYICLGIKTFMVSKWDPRFSEFKNRFPGVRFYRSIVGNVFNSEIDGNFDKVVIPYFKLLDLDWIKDTSRKVPLIALVNHFCRVECPNLEKHSQMSIASTKGDILPRFICNPAGTNFFLPRENVEKILPYVDQIKLVERELPPAYYESYILYYIGKGLLNGQGLNNTFIQQNFALNNDKIRKYKISNLVQGTCKFMCSTCNAKCF